MMTIPILAHQRAPRQSVKISQAAMPSATIVTIGEIVRNAYEIETPRADCGRNGWMIQAGRATSVSAAMAVTTRRSQRQPRRIADIYRSGDGLAVLSK